MAIVRRWPRADAFLALNFASFLTIGGALAIGGYDGPANLLEFFVYACVIMAIIFIAWMRLRHTDFPLHVLALVQIGLVAHFAGAFVSVGNGRLYDQTALGIGYDNLVHLLNAFAGAALISHLLDHYHSIPVLRPWLILGLVLGAGAAVEIVEFAALLVVPDAGIGGYDNNARDLIADLVGAGAFLIVHRLWRPR